MMVEYSGCLPGVGFGTALVEPLSGGFKFLYSVAPNVKVPEYLGIFATTHVPDRQRMAHATNKFVQLTARRAAPRAV